MMRGQDSGEARGRDTAAAEVRVTLGVDTHADVHVGVALDQLGRRLGGHTVPTTPDGYAELVAWAGRFGALERVGIEGTGSYGAGLARWLRARGVVVVEVERPDRHGRQARRRRGSHAPCTCRLWPAHHAASRLPRPPGVDAPAPAVPADRTATGPWPSS